MKYLVDAQLPPLLCKILASRGLEALHVDDIPNGDEVLDPEIARYADQHELIVISKDIDFYHSYMLKQSPKKLLLITIGNIKNKMLFDIFRQHMKRIDQLYKRYDFIELGNNGLNTHYLD